MLLECGIYMLSEFTCWIYPAQYLYRDGIEGDNLVSAGLTNAMMTYAIVVQLWGLMYGGEVGMHAADSCRGTRQVGHLVFV